jgi:LPPG:FO 2-phospho-L-lactate transferase
VVKNVQFEGAETAQMSYGFIDSLQNSELLVFCPSNPIISINPILAVGSARTQIKDFSGLRVAVSPIVGGKAVRGPAAKMMQELGYESSAFSVAQMYQDLCDVFVIDNADKDYVQLIQELGLRVLCTNTIMIELEDKIRLAQEILDYANSA